MSDVIRKDRFGRDVKLDRLGYEYVRDEDGFAFYITPCCDASAKGMEDYTGCRNCYNEIDPILGCSPEPFDEDMTPEQQAARARWKEWEQDMVRKALRKS